MCQCKFRAALCRIKSRPLTSVRASESLVTSSYLSNARERSLDIIKIRASHWIKDNSLFHIASPAIYGLMQRLLSILLLRRYGSFEMFMRFSFNSIHLHAKRSQFSRSYQKVHCGIYNSIGIEMGKMRCSTELNQT